MINRRLWLTLAVMAVFIALFMIMQYFPWFFASPSLAVQSHSEDQTDGIYLLDARWRTWTRLTPNDIFAYSPVWSRDGKTIAFIYKTLHNEETGIGLVDKEKHWRKVFTSSPDSSAFIDPERSKVGWSPDSKKLVFNVRFDKSNKLYLMDLGTEMLRDFNVSIDLSNHSSFYFSWFSDEVMAIELDKRIYQASLDSGNVTYMVDGSNPFWISTSTSLAYVCPIDDKNHICFLNIESKEIRITSLGENVFFNPSDGLSCSLDERFITFIESGGESDPVFVSLFDLHTGVKSRLFRIGWLDSTTLLQIANGPR